MLWDFFDLTGVTDAKGSSFKYEYDNHHNVTKGTSAEKRVLYYQYDDKGNVVKSAAVSAGDETAGTWLTRTMTENQNHMRTVKDARGCQVTYDWDTGKDPLDSVKDARNILWTQGRKLSAISNGSNGKSIRYYYDHTGARVKKTVNGVTTGYRMAGSLLISERTDGTTLWYQYDSAANLVALMIGTERYNYIRNAQNDIIGLIDSTGKRVVSYKYDSWGKVVSITGTLAATVGQKNPFRYRGYYFDAESGMYYLQSRYYDPEIRRFISADDVKELFLELENLMQYNLFAYCFNAPINMFDEDGKWPSFGVVSKIIIGSVAIVAGVAATVLTCGAAAAVPALVGSVKLAAAGAAIGAGINATEHLIRERSMEGLGKAIVDGAATGYMSGGLIAGTMQLGRVALTKGGRGISLGEKKSIELFYHTPNTKGGTIISIKKKMLRIGKTYRFRIDLDIENGLHFHSGFGKAAKQHRKIIPWLFK